MNTSRKIQIALSTIFLWSSTSISSFAATNLITSEKFQSDPVKLPAESIPFGRLNSTQDTYLIAQYGSQIYDMLSQSDYNGDRYFPKFEEAFKKPDGKTILLAFCPSQPQDKVDRCWQTLGHWVIGKESMAIDANNWGLLSKISDIGRAVQEVTIKRQ